MNMTMPTMSAATKMKNCRWLFTPTERSRKVSPVVSNALHSYNSLQFATQGQ